MSNSRPIITAELAIFKCQIPLTPPPLPPSPYAPFWSLLIQYTYFFGSVSYYSTSPVAKGMASYLALLATAGVTSYCIRAGCLPQGKKVARPKVCCFLRCHCCKENVLLFRNNVRYVLLEYIVEPVTKTDSTLWWCFMLSGHKAAYLIALAATGCVS